MIEAGIRAPCYAAQVIGVDSVTGYKGGYAVYVIQISWVHSDWYEEIVNGGEKGVAE